MTERLDIYDEQMNRLGTASREEVHAKGLWHQTFHCWIMRQAQECSHVWFQLRQAGKDTYPNHYDITVAGHLSAGETVKDAVRELEEELGLSIPFDSLIKLGEYREESASEAGGAAFIDRELSHVYGCLCSVPLGELKLQAEEVAGVYEAELLQLIDLFEGRIPQLAVHGVSLAATGELTSDCRTVQVSQFVPRDCAYYTAMFRALQQYV